MSSRMRGAAKNAGLSLLLLTIWTGGAAAEEPPARPRIGLALSGGGARGAAHVGVLKVLEEHRIPIDYIAGTSMGAIVGGLYASGLSAAELETIITTIDWTAAFSDFIPRTERSFRRKRDDDLYLVKNKPGIRGLDLLFPPGLLDGQKIDLLLKRHTLPVVGIRDFDSLGIPFRCVAADLATGEPVVIDRGDLALALRASMSIPIVFAPREIDGRLLVDGGIVRNLPVEVAPADGRGRDHRGRYQHAAAGTGADSLRARRHRPDHGNHDAPRHRRADRFAAPRGRSHPARARRHHDGVVRSRGGGDPCRRRSGRGRPRHARAPVRFPRGIPRVRGGANGEGRRGRSAPRGARRSSSTSSGSSIIRASPTASSRRGSTSKRASPSTSTGWNETWIISSGSSSSSRSITI